MKPKKVRDIGYRLSEVAYHLAYLFNEYQEHIQYEEIKQNERKNLLIKKWTMGLTYNESIRLKNL